MDRLLQLCASCQLAPKRWTAAGPGFFMAGVVVMVARPASVDECSADRRDLPKLAERESPGASGVDVFAHWLKRRPVRPWRFLPLFRMNETHFG